MSTKIIHYSLGTVIKELIDLAFMGIFIFTQCLACSSCSIILFKKIIKLGFEIRGDWFLLWIPIYVAPAGLPNPLTITSLYPHSNCAS